MNGWQAFSLIVIEIAIAAACLMILETKLARGKLVKVWGERLNFVQAETLKRDTAFALFGMGRSADNTDDATGLEVRVISDEALEGFQRLFEKLTRLRDKTRGDEPESIHSLDLRSLSVQVVESRGWFLLMRVL